MLDSTNYDVRRMKRKFRRGIVDCYLTLGSQSVEAAVAAILTDFQEDMARVKGVDSPSNYIVDVVSTLDDGKERRNKWVVREAPTQLGACEIALSYSREKGGSYHRVVSCSSIGVADGGEEPPGSSSSPTLPTA